MTKLLRVAALAALVAWTATAWLGPRGATAAGIVNGIETGERLANVGMLVGRLEPGGDWFWMNCSGTLIARHVFLTAGHCGLNPAVEFGVAFTPSIPVLPEGGYPPIPPEVRVYPGVAHVHPNFDYAAMFTAEDDSFDLMVVVLHEAPRGMPAARVVPPRHFEIFREAYEHLGIGQAGYGTTSNLPLLGLAPFDWGVRRFTTGRLADVYPAKVTVAPAPGQICAGDSGGPGFPVVIHDPEHPVRPYVNQISAVISWTVVTPTTGLCETASILYRLDTPQARGFLAQFVTLGG